MAKTNITVSILGDASNLQRALGQADSKLATFGAKAERVGKSMTMYVSMPLAAGGAAAIKWAGDLEDSGALAAEVFKGNSRDILAWSKTTAKTFGISQKDAVEYANQFGLALQNIGKMSESESAKISQELVGLSADLGSAFGTSNEEAFAALRGALTGEYEMLKKYGIVVNETALKQEYFAMTGEQVSGTLNAQQKQQAALSLITQQTSKVQGDFGRNIDGTTNSLKVAQASAVDLGTSVGTTLLPAFNSILSVGQGAVDMFMSLPEPVQQFAVYAGVAAAAAGPLLTAFGKLAQSNVVASVMGLASGLRETHVAIQGIAATRGVSYLTAFGGVAQASAAAFAVSLGPAILAVTALVAAGGAAWLGYQRNLARVNELTKEAADLAEATGESFDEQSAAFIRTALEGKNALGAANELSVGLQDLADVAITNGAEVQDLAEVWKNYGGEGEYALGKLRNAVNDLPPGPLRDIYTELVKLAEQGTLTDAEVGAFLTSMSEGAQGASKEFDVLRDSLIADIKATNGMSDAEKDHAIAAANAASSIADLSAVRTENGMAADESTAATEANTEAGQANADATDEQTSALQEYTDTLQGTLDPVFGVTDAILDLEDAKRDVAEAQKKVTDLEKIGEKGTAEYADAVRELEDAQRGQVRSAADLESATAKLAEDVRTGAVSFDTGAAALDRWAWEGKITERQAEQTKKELFLAAIAAHNLGRQHPTVTVGAETRGFWQNAINVERWKPQPKYVPIHVDFMGNARGGILGIGGIGRRQYGGPVVKGRPYLVGEVGPEIVVPAFNGHVIPNHAIGPPPASSPPPTVQMELHFHGPVAGQDGARWVAEQIEQAVTAGFPMRRLRQSVAR